MKKDLIIIGILVILKLLLPINPYVELNHIKIIKEIKIECEEEIIIEYKEIIPTKDDNGLEYEYKIKKIKGKKIKEVTSKIKKKKNMYLDKAKIIKKC